MGRKLLWIVLLLVGCVPLRGASSATGGVPRAARAPTAPLTAVASTASPLTRPETCGKGFVTHELDHTTLAGSDAVQLFDSNGAGVAINDLDRDGLLDLVFADLGGPATIFWNTGSLAFRREALAIPSTRAVNSVDVDGDGWLDLVFTHRAAGVSYWRNAGPDTRDAGVAFVRGQLPGVYQPAYAMSWGDLDGDGSLDLVTGAYDAELAKEQRDSFLFGDGAGILVYQQHDERFVPERLSKQSQALAIAIADLGGDGRTDLLIGNDFRSRDQAWQRFESGWDAVEPFAATAHSTMSFDWGDLDNDGTLELFATDMKPYAIDTATLAAWLPVMATMREVHDPDDPQIMENVLQVRQADGRWRNEAYRRGVDATGWSWSGKFGDFDNDGWLDLYVVNGMIAAELFAHLPGMELVEQNQAFRNDGAGHFKAAPQWGLGARSSGRGMSSADLDQDGDLDIVVNNLRSPAQLFENRVCGGASLEVDLRWIGSRNTRAIGAQLVLRTSAGSYTRDVRAASGYLSGDAARVHFGFPADATLHGLEIRWPDGAISQLTDVQPRTLQSVTR